MTADARIDTDFGGYRIESVLGHGGMSVVYRAFDRRLGRWVALKLLAPELADDASFRDRFEREWRQAAALRHPNIIPIFDAGDVDGVRYIAMLLVDGPDLHRLIASGALPLDRAFDILDQVASALDAAHQQGLVHRDVKPGNILIAPGQGRAGRDHAYLVDFGLTVPITATSEAPHERTFVGTLAYMAPELLSGGGAGAPADVYALGCVLFEALTGSPPFRSPSQASMMQAHLTEAVPAVTRSWPDLPAALDDVLAIALAKRPESRYATAGALMTEARNALRSSAAPTIAHDGRRAGAATAVVKDPLRFGASRSRLVAAGAVAFLVGMGAVVLPNLRGSDGSGARPTATASRRASAASSAASSAAGPTATPRATAPRRTPTPSPTASPSPASTPTATASATVAAFTDGERFLISTLPARVAARCIHYEPAPGDRPVIGSTDSVDCAVSSGGIVDVALFLFPSDEPLRAHWAGRVAATAVQPGAGCAGGQEGERAHVRGRVLCFVGTSGRAGVRWTDEDALVYGAINGSHGDLAGAVAYWSDLTGSRVIGPDLSPSEASLLALAPESYRLRCTSFPSGVDAGVPGSVAAIDCDVGSGGVGDFAFFLFDGTSALADFWSARMAAQGIPPDSGQCAAGEPGEGGYARGRLACYIGSPSGNARIRWLDGSGPDYGVLNGTDVDVAGLVAWWSANLERS